MADSAKISTQRRRKKRIDAIGGASLPSRGKRPKHVEVERLLKKLIISQHLDIGHQLPDEYQLAEHLSVSRVTLRRALSSLEDQGLLARRKGRGTFVARMPDEYQDLSRPFYCTVSDDDLLIFPGLHHMCFIVPFSYEEYMASQQSYVFFEMISGMYSQLLEHQLALNVITVKGGMEKIESLCERALKERKLHGLIYGGIRGSQDEEFVGVASKILDKTFPWAVLSRKYFPKDCGFNVVCCDDAPGGYAMVKHLAELGRRRIACFYHNADNIPPGQDGQGSRLNGWRRGMKDARLSIDPKLMLCVEGLGQRRGFEAMQSILRAPESERPTAVCCMSDPWAIGAAEAIKMEGLRIPQDIAVVGFDDMPMVRHTDPGISTVKKHRYELGQAAIQMAVDISRGQIKYPGYRVLEPNLVVRESTVSPLGQT